MSDANATKFQLPAVNVCKENMRESELMDTLGLTANELSQGNRRVDKEQKVQYFSGMFGSMHSNLGQISFAS